jgi:hypothetical protein
MHKCSPYIERVKAAHRLATKVAREMDDKTKQNQVEARELAERLLEENLNAKVNTIVTWLENAAQRGLTYTKVTIPTSDVTYGNRHYVVGQGTFTWHLCNRLHELNLTTELWNNEQPMFYLWVTYNDGL